MLLDEHLDAIGAMRASTMHTYVSRFIPRMGRAHDDRNALTIMQP